MDRHVTQAPKHGRHLPWSHVGLDLLLAGLLSGLLTLVGASLIETIPAADPGASLNCTAFQVGSQRAANTHISVQNDGPARIDVRLDFVDHNGLDAQRIGYSPILDPSESRELAFRTPALGTAVKLIASGPGLQAGVHIHHDDDTPPEIRKAIACHPGG